MSESAGKIQIVIKGGKPWGFRLNSYSENRSAVVIDHIEPGGKAEINGGLKVGDHVIKINDVLCLSLDDALQLIDSAFRTLTVLVWRPSYCSPDNTKNINTELQMPIYNNVPFSSSVQRLNESYFKKFHNLKCNIAVPKVSEKFASNSSECKNTESGNSVQYQFSSFSEASQSVCMQAQSKNSTAHKLSSTDSVNKNYIDNSSQECFKPLLTRSHQSANLQYICEQYPLSEFFFSQKSDLKLESLASHSKRLIKKYQCTEAYANPLDNIIDNQNTSKETHISKIPDSMCCMYPKCHNSYENCKMHSPPERDVTVSQPNIVKHSTNNLHINYGQNFSEKCEPHLVKKLNYPLYKNSFKIKEHGFKNSDLKIFKPVELLADSKLFSNSCDPKQSKKSEIFCHEQIPLLSPKCNIYSNSYKHENKDQQNFRSNINVASAQELSNELTPEVPVGCAFQINHSVEDKSNGYGQNILQKNIFFETLEQQSSYSNVRKHRRPLLEKNEQNMCVGSDDSVAISNKAQMINIFAADYSKSDGDEDEELCLIEENAKNSYSSVASKYSSITPDIDLPPPPLPHDETENVSNDEPLPSPPSFTPVKEVIYENVAINSEPHEAIYANLEMLQIQCSVVNSSTQTNSLKKSSKGNDVESKHLSKQSFSFVETEIFSNVIGPTFGKKFRKDYLQSFLQSQMETYSSVLKETVEKAEKISLERHAVSLPLASAYFTTSEPKAKLLTRYISSLKDGDSIGGELANKKEELMSSINKKLGILRLEQVALKEEMKQNDELGSLLMRKLEKVAQHNEIDKFKTHVEELEKITYLMISLSGRLARAENALLILPPTAHLEEKTILEDKYSKLNKQYEEAKYLKKSIDRRNCQVSMFLRKYFSEEEFADYDHFITMKAKLLVDCREVDEKIKLGEEQLDALKNSLNSQTFIK